MDLPDGLTLEKLSDPRRDVQFEYREDECLVIDIERHPTPYPDHNIEGVGTPARFHVQKTYTYDLETGAWDIETGDISFSWRRYALILVEFDGTVEEIEQARRRLETAPDPRAEYKRIEQEFEDRWRTSFHEDQWGDLPEIPEKQVEAMVDELKSELERRLLDPVTEEQG